MLPTLHENLFIDQGCTQDMVIIKLHIIFTMHCAISHYNVKCHVHNYQKQVMYETVQWCQLFVHTHLRYY